MDCLWIFLHAAMLIGCVMMIAVEVSSNNWRNAVWPLNCAIWVIIAWIRL